MLLTNNSLRIQNKLEKINLKIFYLFFSTMHNAHIGGLVVVSPLPKFLEQILLIINGLLGIARTIKRTNKLIKNNCNKRNKKQHATISVSEINCEINKNIRIYKNIKEKTIQKSKEIFLWLDSINNIEALILFIESTWGLVVAYELLRKATDIKQQIHANKAVANIVLRTPLAIFSK